MSGKPEYSIREFIQTKADKKNAPVLKDEGGLNVFTTE
jgi:hypothetical protein